MNKLTTLYTAYQQAKRQAITRHDKCKLDKLRETLLQEYKQQQRKAGRL